MTEFNGNVKIENYYKEVHVKDMHVGNMTVQNMTVENVVRKDSGSKIQVSGEGFDIEAVPAEYFDFFRWVNLKEARREVMSMRSELAREVERYEDIKHRKTPLMLSVIEPLVLKDRLKHVPTHPVLEALFGDVIDGYSRQAHTKFREELGRKHLRFRPKRKT